MEENPDKEALDALLKIEAERRPRAWNSQLLVSVMESQRTTKNTTDAWVIIDRMLTYQLEHGRTYFYANYKLIENLTGLDAVSTRGALQCLTRRSVLQLTKKASKNRWSCARYEINLWLIESLVK